MGIKILLAMLVNWWLSLMGYYFYYGVMCLFGDIQLKSVYIMYISLMYSLIVMVINYSLWMYIGG